MVYVICFPMRKCSRDVQTWTLTSLICCSSSPLNNPPSVFLGEKSCNQILIPEAQTRWWQLKSWRSLGFFFSRLCFSFFFSPSVCLLCFISLVLCFSLLSFVVLSSPFFHLVHGGVQCQETRENDLEPRVKAHLKTAGLFSHLHAERGGEGTEKGKKGM